MLLRCRDHAAAFARRLAAPTAPNPLHSIPLRAAHTRVLIQQHNNTQPPPTPKQQAAFVGAVAVADLVKSTLGPKGMDKILQSMGRGQEVTVTNDGATILKSIHVDNPAAKVLVGEWLILSIPDRGA